MIRKSRLSIVILACICVILTIVNYVPHPHILSLNEKLHSFRKSRHPSFVIEPNNVEFYFTNPKGISGNANQVVERNKRRYQQLFSQEITEPLDCELHRPGTKYKKANATIIALVRNNEGVKLGRTIKSLQQKFNNRFNYPYTFINDQPFTDGFKAKIMKYVGDNTPVEFVTIPEKLWDKPDSIDVNRETISMSALAKENVAYAHKASYHNMCRFYSGNFYNVPELQKYKYYWRIEPNVDFYTDINYDVFKYMEDTKKVYGFTISLADIHQSIKTLWPETLAYLNTDDNYKYINPNGSFQWLVDPLQNPIKYQVTGGYSTCHFWSNFEIGDMDFFRGEAYNNWFKYLDSTGKFYYERWGDAPVHSIGVSLFAPSDKVHWFRDIGYFHDPYFNCPNNKFTSGCKMGKFSLWEHLWDQNCVSTWADYHMKEGVY